MVSVGGVFHNCYTGVHGKPRLRRNELPSAADRKLTHSYVVIEFIVKFRARDRADLSLCTSTKHKNLNQWRPQHKAKQHVCVFVCMCVSVCMPVCVCVCVCLCFDENLSIQ